MIDGKFRTFEENELIRKNKNLNKSQHIMSIDKIELVEYDLSYEIQEVHK